MVEREKPSALMKFIDFNGVHFNLSSNDFYKLIVTKSDLIFIKKNVVS